MKCPHCGQEIPKTVKVSKDNWIWIPELKIYVEKDVHHKNYSYDQLKEIYGKNFEKMLLTKSQVGFLRDHSEYSKIFKLRNTLTNDFYIQQYDEADKKNGYVADFCVGRSGPYFDSGRYSDVAYDCRGVRFARKKIPKR